MSVREGAEMGMQPLDVAQNGARTPPGCRYRIQDRLLPVCFAHPGTCSKQTRQFHSIEACASVLTQAVRARVADVWCYSTDLRATEVPQVHSRWIWDRPTLERNSAFEARIVRLAAVKGTTGPTLKRGCGAFVPLVQGRNQTSRPGTRHVCGRVP